MLFRSATGATIAGQGAASYTPDRRKWPEVRKESAEVALVHGVRACGTCSFFWPDDVKQQPYGPYTAYDVDTDTPYTGDADGSPTGTPWVLGRTAPPAFPNPAVAAGCLLRRQLRAPVPRAERHLEHARPGGGCLDEAGRTVRFCRSRFEVPERPLDRPHGRGDGRRGPRCARGGVPGHRHHARRVLRPGSCLQQTLAQIFGDDPNIGYILWNDEVPDGVPDDFRFTASRDSSSYGHTKGVLGFDKSKGTAFYLVHSTPKFPAVGQPLVPSGQNENGQTYLCVSLSYAAANDIAEVLRLHHRPQVYASKLPGVGDDESLSQLATATKFPAASKVPAAVDLSSKAGQAFRFFGKSKAWSQARDGVPDGLDFWSDLVGPSLRVNLDVETWRNGTPAVFSDLDEDPTTDQGDGLETLDVLEVNLGKIGRAHV